MTSGLLPVAKRWWWLLTVAALVAGMTSYAAAAQIEPTYQAETKMLVGPINTDNDTLRAAGALGKTYAELATTAPLNEVERELGINVSSKDVSAAASEITRLLTITVRDKNPQRAALVANALADKVLALPRSGIARPEGQLQIVERASVPSDPSGPPQLLIVPLAAIAGLLAALGVAVFFEAINRTVRNADELSDVAPVPFLGSVNGTAATPPESLVLRGQPNSRADSAYRLLAAKVQYTNGERAPQSLLVAATGDPSAAAHMGVNLAAALTDGLAKVALVDVTGTGELARYVGLEVDGKEGGGQFEALDPVRCTWGRLQRFRLKLNPRLIFVPGTAQQPANVDEARGAIDALLAECDLVVLAALAVESSPSALVWARAADGTILLVERDRTKRDAINPAVQTLGLVGANVVGTVLAGHRA